MKSIQSNEFLRSLAIAVAATAAAVAAKSEAAGITASSPEQAAPSLSSVEARVETVRSALFQPPANAEANATAEIPGAAPMWWGNWHNWHNWHNGGWNNWHNWHNGGWGNWHNF